MIHIFIKMHFQMEIALRLLTQGTFPKQACGCLGEELLGCNTQKGNSGTGSNWWRADTRRATPLKALAWACGRPRSSGYLDCPVRGHAYAPPSLPSCVYIILTLIILVRIAAFPPSALCGNVIIIMGSRAALRSLKNQVHQHF